MDYSEKTLAKRYAQAYMSPQGEDKSPQAASRARLDGLRSVSEAARPFTKILTRPAVSAEAKLDVLSRLLGPGIKGAPAGLAELLVRKGRFALLGDILEESVRINDSVCGVLRAELYSRYELSAGELARIETMLSGMTKKKIALRVVLTERVVGGFEIKVGDVTLDATVRGRLDELKKELLG